MKTKLILSCLLIVCFLNVKAQTDKKVVLKTETGDLYGTLLVPEMSQKMPVALLIAGSGPTDRNGNSSLTQNNTLKMLADTLYAHGIASLRYDKRGIAASKAAGMDESKLRFDNYVQDAEGWVDFLKHRNAFSAIVIIGHSEGSLIGMIAAQKGNVSKFVSLEGAGEPAPVIIKRQLAAQSEKLVKACSPILDTLAAGKTIDSVSLMFYSLFRPSLQPYLISWFQYNPQTEISKLKMPVLIVQGTTDLQVGVEDAEKLAQADPKATLVIIKGMNHILKDAPPDRQENVKTYFEPNLPLNGELVKAMVKFIKN